MSSLPPPPELDELDEGWGDEDYEKPTLSPSRGSRTVGPKGGPAASDLAEAPSPEGETQAPDPRQIASPEGAPTDSDLAQEAASEGAPRVPESRIAALERNLEERSAALTKAEERLEHVQRQLEDIGRQLDEARVTERQLHKQLEQALARAGASGGDDLQEIRGIGPKLSQKLKALGIARFSDLAALDAAGAQQLATKLGVSRRRIERDGWIAAASKLSGRVAD